MMLVRAFCFLFILVLLVSCSAQYSQSEEDIKLYPNETKIQISDQPELAPPGEESKNYVSGEILVKFKDGISGQTVEAIQKEVHLETIRLVSKANLYLMKILDGSSVESVVERLQHYKEVEYAEPNYIRTTK